MIRVRADGFQSAPLTEARGDPLHYVFSGSVASFNPLPSPKRGETPIRVAMRKYVEEFQSAPLTEARGDWSGA